MFEPLEQYLQQLTSGGIAVAFSGGVDSSLLLAVLGKMNQKRPFPLVALTMHSVLQNDEEIAEAQNFSAESGVNQQLFSFNPFVVDEVRHNLVDRCYYCKKAIFSQFMDYIGKQGFKYLLDGTNADDLKVYRPGRKALQELGVISPFAELGIGKAQIREMSAELGLSTARKPAVPCLATRFEYNTLLNEDMIKKVAEGEALIKKIFPDIEDVRLRVHRNLVRIEVSKNSIAELIQNSAEIIAELKKLGFEFVTLDMEGFRSGSFDRGLK